MYRELLSWFDRHKRPLPWRRDRSPYRVWIAEVMLQQTRVATAIPYYHRWLERFPTVSDLATAPLDEVLKCWEGLGYYGRARRLHETAGLVQERFAGRFPADPTALSSLPGIGPYTAAAIASIAFGVPVVAVDANVARVTARLLARGDLDLAAMAAELAPLQPAARPGDFNEALMELGALVCTTRAPDCPSCPLRQGCRAYLEGSVDSFPPVVSKPPRQRRLRYALVHVDAAGVALRQRESDELLRGLWGFVQSESEPGNARLLDPIRHSYTHFDLTLIPALVPSAPAGTVPVSVDDLGTIAASRVDRRLLERLQRDDGSLPLSARPMLQRDG